MSKRIVGFLNSYSTGASGGDVRFVELMGFFPATKKLVVTSKLGKAFCLNRGLEACFIETSYESEFRFKKVVIIYLRRLFNILTRPPAIVRGDVLYIGSDIIPDVLPAFLNRLLKRDIVWVQMIFHIIPQPFFRAGRVNLSNTLSYIGQRIALLLVKKRADKVIVINQIVRDYLIQYGIKKDKVYIGGMGIDRSFFDRLIPTEMDRFDGVFIGRIHPSKGVFDLVDIWNNVCRYCPNARLAVIGDGNISVKEDLCKRIKRFSLDNNILLMGYLNESDAYSLLKMSKIFLFPSYEEGWGLVIAEAMACGVPVVTYNLDIYKEVFPSGLAKIQTGNKDEFARMVVELLRDEHKRNLLSSQGLENLDSYTWDYAGQKEWAIINEGKI